MYSTVFQSSPKDGSNVDHPHFVYEDRPETSSSSGVVDGQLNCKNTMMDGKVVLLVSDIWQMYTDQMKCNALDDNNNSNNKLESRGFIQYLP